MEKVVEAQKTIKIENVVASTSINHKIDITALSENLDGVEYNPKRLEMTWVGLHLRMENIPIGIYLICKVYTNQVFHLANV